MTNVTPLYAIPEDTDPRAVVLALLKSASFTTDGEETLDWTAENHACALLRGPLDMLPRDRAGFERRLSGQDRNSRSQALRSLTWDGAQYSLIYGLRTFDGREIWIEERGQRLSGNDKTPTKIVGVMTNIDDRKSAMDAAVYRASYDDLTGLWNRSRIREGVTQLLALAQRTGRSGAFLRLRVSNLADVNATYGYEAGDRLLVAIAARLKTAIRAPDIVGRMAGGGFGVGLTECDRSGLTAFAARITEHLSDTPYTSPHGDLYAEFDSAGTLLFPEGDQGATTTEDAFTQTRQGLVHSQSRRGEFILHDATLMPLSMRGAQGETRPEDILTALNDRRISLAYQPIVEAKTRNLHHYECLLRLCRDDGEIVSAGGFIMEAERLGLVHLLDRRALELAAQTLHRDPHVRLALNVSAGTVKNTEAAAAYLAALKALGPATRRVTLELTETVALHDPTMASRFSVDARSLGVDFAIDDFGSGYTTFQNLMAIEADTIKIDGSFIQDLAMTPHKQTFVRMMVDLAQTFSVKTVAEMVDSRENADLLMRLGVDYLQGYLFGIPSGAPAFQKVG